MTDILHLSLPAADGPEIRTAPIPLEDFQKAARKVTGKPPMRQSAEDKAVSDRAYGVAAGELTQFIERVEHLEEEKYEIAEQIKEVMAEAKGRGYDTKVMRKIIAMRRRDPDDLAEENAVLEMYKAALGMA